MHIAILVTNTDESEFADRHPKDGEKFTTLLHSVRSDWQLSVFEVKDDEFPGEVSLFDGFVITGSPASLFDDSGWINTLKELVVEVHRAGQPIFGACFGHQLIAEALGGTVGKNAQGWELGTVDVHHVNPTPWTKDLSNTGHLYAAHIEQVSELPAGAELLAQRPGCQFAGFRIGTTIYTTQYHPEMEPNFIEALTRELTGKLPDDVIARSAKSLKQPADYRKFAESIARFFEFQ